MYLSDILNELTYGELSQLNLGIQKNGETPEDKLLPLISHINRGLSALYTRFFLKEGRFNFALVAGAYGYDLQREDLLKIEQVFTEEGAELPVNDGTKLWACFTPTMQQLRVAKEIVDKDINLPTEYITNGLEVVYRANHPRVTDGTLPESTVIELPYSHLNALLYFVASRAYTPMGLVNQYHQGDSWAARYEAECLRLEAASLQIDTDIQNSRLYDKGWE